MRLTKAALACMSVVMMAASCGGSGGDAGQLTPPAGTVVGQAGAALRVEFRVVDPDGRAAQGVVVSFRLVGAPEGSTLSSTSELSDAEGLVATRVTAPVPATFPVVAGAVGRGGAGAAVETTTPASSYRYCESTADCDADQSCFEVSTSETGGAFCTAECTTSSDCPGANGFPGACKDPDGMGGICFQQCDFDADCDPDSVCLPYEDFDGFIEPVCLPSRR